MLCGLRWSLTSSYLTADYHPAYMVSINGDYRCTYGLRSTIASHLSNTEQRPGQEQVSDFAQLPSDTESLVKRGSFPGATHVAWTSTTSNHKQAASNLEQFLSSCAMVALSTNLAPSLFSSPLQLHAATVLAPSARHSFSHSRFLADNLRFARQYETRDFFFFVFSYFCSIILTTSAKPAPSSITLQNLPASEALVIIQHQVLFCYEVRFKSTGNHPFGTRHVFRNVSR